MRISDRIANLKPSATLAVSEKAAQLKAQGKEIISLSVGQPDFNTPAHVRDACKKALDEGVTGYTQVPGLPELRQAMSGYFKRFYGVTAKPENTISSCGGKHSLYSLFMAIINPGDEVLIPAPYWVSYPPMVELAQGVPVIIPTKAENNFLATVEELDKAVTDKTTTVIINSPSNPTGYCYSAQAIKEIMDWALERNIYVISDEVYDQLVYPPAEFASISPYWEKNPERVAIVNALSKSFAMTGWRMGFTLADEGVIKGMSKIQSQSTTNVTSFVQKAATEAFNGPFDEVEKMRAAFAKRRDLCFDMVSAWPDVTCAKPEGAFYLFPVVDAYYKNGITGSTDLCTKILEEAGVALVPGVAFGDDRCIRFSYALDEKTLETALNRVADVLKSI